jgi:hypothetical protein
VYKIMKEKIDELKNQIQEELLKDVPDEERLKKIAHQLSILRLKKGVRLGTFGSALCALKMNYKVERKGWNGKGMFLVYFSPLAHKAEMLSVEGHGTYPLAAFILMKTVDNLWIPWLASESDVLADDWYVVCDEDEEVK